MINNNDIEVKRIHSIEPFSDFISENSIPLYHNTELYGAFYQNQIIGIVSFVDKIDHILIASIFVLGLFRGFGVGSKLINTVTGNMKKKAIVKYNSKGVDVEQFNDFLVKNNWEKLMYEFSTYRIDRSTLKDNRVLNRWVMGKPSTIPVTCIDMASMNYDSFINACTMAAQLIDEEHLLPVYNIKRVIPKLSFFMFDGDKLVAWVTTERQGKDEIYLRCSFVHKQYRNLGLGLLLWQQILKGLDYHKEFECIKYCSFCFDKHNNRLYKTYNTIWNNSICLKYESFYAEKN